MAQNLRLPAPGTVRVTERKGIFARLPQRRWQSDPCPNITKYRRNATNGAGPDVSP